MSKLKSCHQIYKIFLKKYIISNINKRTFKKILFTKKDKKDILVKVKIYIK